MKVTYDFTLVVFEDQEPERRRRIAERVRQVGLKRVVYGSDLVDPKANWAEILRALPLTRAEFRTMAANVSPLLR